MKGKGAPLECAGWNQELFAHPVQARLVFPQPRAQCEDTGRPGCVLRQGAQLWVLAGPLQGPEPPQCMSGASIEPATQVTRAPSYAEPLTGG